MCLFSHNLVKKVQNNILRRVLFLSEMSPAVDGLAECALPIHLASASTIEAATGQTSASATELLVSAPASASVTELVSAPASASVTELVSAPAGAGELTSAAHPHQRSHSCPSSPSGLQRCVH